MRASERAIIDGAERRREARIGLVSSNVVARMTSGQQPKLNSDQAAAVRALTSSGHGVEVVCALAGTGKTTMVANLAACYRVIGTAPTARAARELRDVGGIPAGTMHALLGELDRAGGFPERAVLVIDEAGMASTQLAAAVFAHAERAETKIVAIGDPGQLASVQAGGWLCALASRHPGPELRHVIRQRDPSERAALEALHDGHPDVYLEHKTDAITVHPAEADALEALVAQWDTARHEYGIAGAVMIARDNQTREQLNHAARQRLKQDLTLPGRGVRVADRDYAPGDRIVARRNHPGADIDNGTLATVVAIDGRSHRMVIDTGVGQHRHLDLAYVAHHVEHAYALTAHSAQGTTVAWAGVIGRPDEFTREWAYTALSRARGETTLHLIAEPSPQSRVRQEFAPAEPERAPSEALGALERRMRHSEHEPLALDHSDLRRALARRAVHTLPTAPIRQGRLPLSPSARGPTVHR